ncbi:MAG: rhodanese-like domain-containing protein [Bacteroidetes bacterium]|nr:rhodanese-like domain-containing protein [Bacteroidota bacterium]
MIQSIKNLLGIGPKVNIGELISNGAIIIDVRTRGEYAGGHAKGSVNVPLDQLSGYLPKLKNKDQAIITCCASGMRSASAKSFFKGKGYTNVHNAGPWITLNKYCK